MGYMHIDNLYKNQEILMFRECYAMEKIHGTSAHIAYKDGQLRFFSGGASHTVFKELFDEDALKEKLAPVGDVVIYGEAYGGKIMKMRDVYGEAMRFVAFDVKITDLWLAVPQAEDFVKEVGLEFVDYALIPTEITAIDEQRDRDSVQAVRNGCGEGHQREGIVLRPLIELTKNNGTRILVKHKGDKFRETSTPRPVDPAKLKVMEEAGAIATEWVTPMRIVHVLDKMDNPGMENMREIIAAMCEDVQREGEGEIVWNNAVSKAVGKATAQGVKAHFQAKLHQ
tara:strand:+ start:3380 stop:4228 length:849 start_codon:yes stop_codon:yes gene_type:complete